MRAINIEDLKEGMKTARSIYDESGRILLTAGIVLNSLYINKLASMGLPFVYIEDEVVGPLEVSPIIRDKVNYRTVKVIKDVVKSASVQNKVDMTVVSSIVNEILDELKGESNVLFQLIEPSKADSLLYSHSVGVCILSILTGMAMGFDDLKLKTLAMGAIMHDIGKSTNSGPEHTTRGFELLRENKAFSIFIAHVAFQHHERHDGTGYPRGIKGEEIHPYAAITSVCNEYYNCVTNPNSRMRLHPSQALEKILEESGKAFRPEVVRAFSTIIAPYPVGATVRLNNGVVGVVVDVFRDYPTRPVVKIITNEEGVVQKEFDEINLTVRESLWIKEVISEKERRKILRTNPA